MYFVVFSILLGTFSAAHSKSNIYWTNVTENTLLLVKSEAAGLLENGTQLYACKMWADNRWVIGSYFFLENYNTSDCTVVTYRKAFKTKDFKVLIYPPGSVSWIRSTGRYSENCVPGGGHRLREEGPGYVCRAKWKNSLLVGITLMGGAHCYMPQDDKEILVNTTEKIEILTENRYGKLFDENFPRE